MKRYKVLSPKFLDTPHLNPFKHRRTNIYGRDWLALFKRVWQYIEVRTKYVLSRITAHKLSLDHSPRFKRAVTYFKKPEPKKRKKAKHFEFTIHFRWLLPLLLIPVLWPHGTVKAVYEYPVVTKTYSKQKPVKVPVIAPQQPVDAIAPPAPVYVPPTPVIGCGSDPYMAYIYEHESGCNTASINSIGCAGLGQACPGSKLPCSLSDWACQDAYFTNYAVSRYGSTYNAYLTWLNQHWW